MAVIFEPGGCWLEQRVHRVVHTLNVAIGHRRDCVDGYLDHQRQENDKDAPLPEHFG